MDGLDILHEFMYFSLKVRDVSVCPLSDLLRENHVDPKDRVSLVVALPL